MLTAYTNNYGDGIIHMSVLAERFCCVHLTNDTLPLAISRENLYFRSVNKMHKIPLFVVVFFKIHFHHGHYGETYADQTVLTVYNVITVQTHTIRHSAIIR